MKLVYGKPGCPYTRALLRKLRHDGEEFQELDAQNDQQTRAMMLSLNGGLPHTPTILDVDAQTVTVGFHGH